MGKCHVFVNTDAFHKYFCQLLTDNGSSRLFTAPPLATRTKNQPAQEGLKSVQGPTDTHWHSWGNH